MKRPLFLILAFLFCLSLSAEEIPFGYYDAINGKQDSVLKSTLSQIVRGGERYEYGPNQYHSTSNPPEWEKGDFKAYGTWQALPFTDHKPGTQGGVWDMYSNCVRYYPNKLGDSGCSLNIEHCLPKSWWGGEVNEAYKDLYNLNPSDQRANSQKSNYAPGHVTKGDKFNNGSFKMDAAKSSRYGYICWEPAEEYRGDFARTYFYMATCYKNELPSWPGSAQLDYKTNKYKAFSTWTINMLMEWTRLDPVSDKEIKRNEAIYGIQGNRNPFIDHPELAEHIWGNQQGQPWNGSGGETPATITTPANGSTIDMGTTVVGTPLHYTVTVKGTGLNKWLSLSMSDNVNFYVNTVSFNPLDVNIGTSFDITFNAEKEGYFENNITLSNDEVTTTFTISATANKQGDTPPPAELGDSIIEDWEGCATGGYWTKRVEGNAFPWYFRDAGIWSDSMSHGELSCRFGKTSSSAITMLESVEDVTGIGFYATCFGNDSDAELSIAYSTDYGSSWYGLDVVTVTRGALQQFILDVELTISPSIVTRKNHGPRET